MEMQIYQSHIREHQSYHLRFLGLTREKLHNTLFDKSHDVVDVIKLVSEAI